MCKNKKAYDNFKLNINNMSQKVMTPTDYMILICTTFMSFTCIYQLGPIFNPVLNNKINIVKISKFCSNYQLLIIKIVVGF